MRLLFVVHRYGEGVAGGAEIYCRLLAEHLAAEGHDVHVVTSCATSYVDWANVLPPGRSELGGVTVHRLPVHEERDAERFGRLSSRVLSGGWLPPWHLQQEWMRRQGPVLDGLEAWLTHHAGGFDVANVVTYLYATTAAALPVLAGRLPVLLHPTAHDEPPLRLPLFDPIVHLADALAFLTDEEEALVRSRFGARQPGAVVGIGADLDAARGDGGAAFRAANGLADDPYLLCLGRVDASKGTPELIEWFGMYQLRRHRALRLAVVGDPVDRPVLPPGAVLTGVIDDELKRSALSGALALVQPSYFESFAMVLTEAWVAGVPGLVQGRSPVLGGQARRSGGAIAYEGFAQFEAALDLLIDRPALRERLGAAGRLYVERRYAWPAVLERYLELVARVRPTAGRRGGARSVAH